MDPEGFPGALFRAWEPRISIPTQLHNPALALTAANHVTGLSNATAGMRSEPARSFEFGFTSGVAMPGTRAAAKNLEELFKDYGVRLTTLAKMAEMGFTVQTLVNMTDEELEDVIKTMVEVYRVELLVGEKYGVKSAIRAERKHLDEELDRLKGKNQTRSENKRRRVDDPCVVAAPRELPLRRESNIISMIPDNTGALNLNAGRDPMLLAQQQQQLVPAGTPTQTPTAIVGDTGSDRRHTKKKQKRKRYGEDGEDRPREHPFIVTEPGELARGKKNGLDYLFDLYEQCGKYLEEVQHG